MSTVYKINVMQGEENGKDIEYKRVHEEAWLPASTPLWQWNDYEYRIKPEPKEPSLLERIEGKWPDKSVVMLDRKQQDGILGLWPLFGFTGHTHAQSMKGFAGYVYDIEGLFTKVSPTFRGTNNTNFPVAVLFTK